MDVRREREATPTKNRTGVERKSERELVVTRTVNAPARLVFELKQYLTLLFSRQFGAT